MNQRVLWAATVVTLELLASAAVAGGLGIGTQSGSGTGNAFSGGAAAAEDASTVWYNPAGMTLLPGRGSAAVAMHALRPSFKFENRRSTLAAGTGEGGDGGDWAYVPQAFYSRALNDKTFLGIAFNVPFGLGTKYDAGWRGVSVAKDSDLKTFNLNLALAYKISDAISVGAGLSVQRAELMFNRVPAPAVGLAEVKLDDTGWGANVGLLAHPSKDTRFGIHYRSSVKYDLSGSIMASPVIGGNSNAVASVRTPENVSVSVFTSLTPRWDLMADATWTRWSRLKQLDVYRSSGAFFTNLVFNWGDTMRYSIGANYKVSTDTTLRFGLAYDETPSNDVDRTPRVPDQDRTWVAFGVKHRVSKSGTIDLGYAHEFIRDASVDNPGVGGGRLIGVFNNRADILSVQYSHSF